MKNLLLLFTAFIVFQSFAQQPFLQIENDKKQGGRVVKDCFTVVDSKTGNFALFLDDNKTMNGYLYNPERERIGAFASEGLPKKKKYDEVIGQTVKGSEITLFLKKSNNKKFGSIRFDFANQNSVETEFDFKLKKEAFVQTYSNEDRFYLITISKRSSDLNIYTFENGKSFTKKTLSFSEEKILDEDGKETTLYNLMSVSAGLGNSIAMTKIDEHTPNSIEATSDASKLYTRDASFLISLDKNKRATYLIEISVPNLTAQFTEVKKPALTEETIYAKSNSFVYDDKLFQIVGSNAEMKFSVKALPNLTILKDITLLKEDDISFKNTPIIQEGGVYKKDRVREMEKTSKFLRKISADKIGIAVKPTNEGYQITMGGTKKLNAGGGAPMMMPGFGAAVPVGAIGGAVSISFNPIFYAYNSYTTTKSTRIESLFDANFQHVAGEIQDNAFDKIQQYADDQRNAKVETVLRYKNGYLYGNYKNKAQVYELTYFTD